MAWLIALENRTFSLLLSNLFIGLCKGSRILQNYSKVFNNDLGYEIFKFEPSFTSSAGRVNPDVIIISDKVKNTLIVEWTEASSVGDDKMNQLNRYSKITNNDLVNVAAIPITSVQTYDTMLIVLPDSFINFDSFLKSRHIEFPILTFEIQTDQYFLDKRSSSFRENKTNEFFTNGIKIQRIPLHYLPIQLDQISIQSIVTFVVRHLISLIIKGVPEFSIEEFCEGYIPVWKFIDLVKQSQIKKVTKKVLSDLIKKPIGANILIRIVENPPRWEIKDDFNIKVRKKSVIKSLEEFIKEEKGETYQLEIDFNQDNE